VLARRPILAKDLFFLREEVVFERWFACPPDRRRALYQLLPPSPFAPLLFPSRNPAPGPNWHAPCLCVKTPQVSGRELSCAAYPPPLPLAWVTVVEEWWL